jgi:hypothetical protein
MGILLLGGKDVVNNFGDNFELLEFRGIEIVKQCYTRFQLRSGVNKIGKKLERSGLHQK